MSDFDYDVWQRKIIARGASHRKCGSKSKKCDLPSDHMTAKEWKERCGSVITFNMNSPMSWEQFEIMPDDIKHDYISKLHYEYGANMRNLSDMFGVSYDRVRRSILSLGIVFPNGKHMDSEQRAVWNKFTGIIPIDSDHLDTQTIADPKNNCIVSQQPDEHVTDVCKQTGCMAHHAQIVTENKKSMNMNQFSMKFAGVINIGDIADSLMMVLGGGYTGEMQIICNLNPA